MPLDSCTTGHSGTLFLGMAFLQNDLWAGNFKNRSRYTYDSKKFGPVPLSLNSNDSLSKMIQYDK